MIRTSLAKPIASLTEHLGPFVDRRGWNLAAGLRAGVVCSVPLLLADLLGRWDLSWMAVIGFWMCLADPGGAVRTRVSTLAGFGLAATAAAFLGVLAQPDLWLAVALALTWCFAGGLVRVWGDAAAAVGTLGSVALVVVLGMGHAAGGPRAAAGFAGLTLAGAVWAGVMVLVLWRQHPYAAARRSVAIVLRDIAAYLRALAELQRPGADAQAWARMARERRRACRDAIEAARRALVHIRRHYAGRSARASHLLLLLADADRAFATVIALDELLDSTRGAGQDRVVRVALLRLASRVARVAQAAEIGAAGRRVDPDQILAGLRERLAGGDPVRQHAVDLFDQLSRWISAALEQAGGAFAARPPAPDPAEDPPPRPWRELRVNLTAQSLAFRHAARLAVTAALAVLISGVSHAERGYWITITAVTILQPYLSASWRRALERVAGSVVGGQLAAGLALVVDSPVEIALLAFPLSVLTLAVRGVSYSLFILCLTPQFVLIAELSQPGGLDPALAGLRVLDTVLGGALGLAASLLLWPSWEAPRLAGRVAAAVRANRGYLLAALDAVGGIGPAAAIEPARRRAGLASNNAEASIQRLMGEPLRRRSDDAEPAWTAITATRRLAGVAAALVAVPEAAAGADAQGLADVRRWLADGLDAAAASFDGGTAPPPLPPVPEAAVAAGLLARELLRARRQVAIVHDAADRLAGTRQVRPAPA